MELWNLIILQIHSQRLPHTNADPSYFPKKSFGSFVTLSAVVHTKSVNVPIYSQVKPDSKGCLETAEDRRYPKLFKLSLVKNNYGKRHIRLETVVFIHDDKQKNPAEWTKLNAPYNTDKVLLFKHMIEDISSEKGYTEKWRYFTDYESDGGAERFHPRHMKIVYVTPEEGKVCLRPDMSNKTVFTVKRHYMNTSVSKTFTLAMLIFLFDITSC